MYSIIYTTVGSTRAAEDLSTELVERKLVACVNALEIISTYRWKEGITSEKEIGMLLKTRKDKVDELLRVLDEIHPYDVPCALEISVEKGLPAFFRWIDSEVQST